MKSQILTQKETGGKVIWQQADGIDGQQHIGRFLLHANPLVRWRPGLGVARWS